MLWGRRAGRYIGLFEAHGFATRGLFVGVYFVAALAFFSFNSLTILRVPSTSFCNGLAQPPQQTNTACSIPSLSLSIPLAGGPMLPRRFSLSLAQKRCARASFWSSGLS